MIETLLPLFYLHFTAPAPEMMAPVEMPAPAMMEQQEARPTFVPKQHRKQSWVWGERPIEIRRKGNQPTDKNYFTKRLKHAVDASDPNFPTTDLSQRTSRELTQTNRRMDRMMRGYPRACEFPCTE